MRKVAGFYQKQIPYKGKKLTLFSQDGVSWFSSKEEIRRVSEKLIAQRDGLVSKMTPTS